jgi:hypothetical protein
VWPFRNSSDIIKSIVLFIFVDIFHFHLSAAEQEQLKAQVVSWWGQGNLNLAIREHQGKGVRAWFPMINQIGLSFILGWVGWNKLCYIENFTVYSCPTTTTRIV